MSCNNNKRGEKDSSSYSYTLFALGIFIVIFDLSGYEPQWEVGVVVILVSVVIETIRAMYS